MRYGHLCAEIDGSVIEKCITKLVPNQQRRWYKGVKHMMLVYVAVKIYLYLNRY
jgi:hypothetical protein